MMMFVRRFKKFFRKENSGKGESCNKSKSSKKGKFQGCFKCGKMDQLIKDCPLLKEDQRKNLKKQQQLALKAFKKAMKATWGETYDEELEGEDGENDNMTLMARSDTNSDSNSTKVSAQALNKGTVLEIDSLNVPSGPRHELKSSGGTIPETMVSSIKRTEEKTTPDSVPETQNYRS
ncbi:hypothetical protein HAX54_001422 [Datura stramonium]|uniref:CCHC-type domain-containing protein n=1 Tax=Datura stramonium TaxID=4076 RepID=A0ABS8T311_DATST|nr:hypothetical protein [Datura stramonium]